MDSFDELPRTEDCIRLIAANDFNGAARSSWRGWLLSTFFLVLGVVVLAKMVAGSGLLESHHSHGPSTGQVIVLSFDGPRRGAQEVGLAGKLRLEFPEACYQVSNRGNDRRHVFGTAGAQITFETCLFEACAKSGWALHAFVIRGNHYPINLVGNILV